MPVAFWLVTCFNITIDAIYPNRLRGKSKSKMLCLESTNYPEAGLDECLKFCEWPYNNWIVNLLPCALSNMLQSKTDTPCQWIPDNMYIPVFFYINDSKAFVPIYDIGV